MAHSLVQDQLGIRYTFGGLAEQLLAVKRVCVTCDHQCRRADLPETILEAVLVFCLDGHDQIRCILWRTQYHPTHQRSEPNDLPGDILHDTTARSHEAQQ